MAFFYTVLVSIYRKNLVGKINIYNQQLNNWQKIVRKLIDGVERLGFLNHHHCNYGLMRRLPIQIPEKSVTSCWWSKVRHFWNNLQEIQTPNLLIKLLNYIVPFVELFFSDFSLLWFVEFFPRLLSQLSALRSQTFPENWVGKQSFFVLILTTT